MKFQKQANNSYDKVENVADDSIINTGDEGSNEATESQDENQLEIREINLEEMGEESEDTTENNTLKVLNHQIGSLQHIYSNDQNRTQEFPLKWQIQSRAVQFQVY